MVARPLPRWGSIRSTSTRLNISLQPSSAASFIPATRRLGGERRPVGLAAAKRRQEVDAGVARECLGDGQALRCRERVGTAAAET